MVLNLRKTQLPSLATIALFGEIRKGSKLGTLDIRHNDIDDKTREAIATTLKDNESLVWLWMVNNKISAEAAKYIMKEALCFNDTLQDFSIPLYCKENQNVIMLLLDKINKRESRCCNSLQISFDRLNF